MKLLFICNENTMRSRTAELVYSADKRHTVKSAGVSKTAKVKVNSEFINWADIIFVMEEEQQEFITKNFPGESGFREIVVLGIDDHYYIMEPGLVELLKARVEPHLEE